MSRGSRALCALYLLASAYLAWCTVHTWGRAADWASTLNIAASVVFILSLVRELDLRDARRRNAALAERAAREHKARNGRPLNQLEQAMWVGLAAQLTGDDQDAA